MLFRKQRKRRLSGGLMDMEVGFFLKPPPGRFPEVFHIPKIPAIKQVAFHVPERRFDFSLCLGPSGPARNGLAVIVRDKRGERRVIDRPACLPP